MFNKAEIINIHSHYILHNILSFLKYDNALNLIKYNKKLQNRLNLNSNDYSIDYKLVAVKIKRIQKSIVINQVNIYEYPIIFYLKAFVKIIFSLLIILSCIHFNYSAYTFGLIFGIIYLLITGVYLLFIKLYREGKIKALVWFFLLILLFTLFFYCYQ